MSQDDIHSSLENARVAAEGLVSEMGEYRTAKQLRDADTEALNQINESLAGILERIRPYREDQTRRFRMLMFGGTALNSTLIILLLAVIIIRT